MKIKIAILMLSVFVSLPIFAQQYTDGFFTYNYSERSDQSMSFFYAGEFTLEGMDKIVDAPTGDALFLFLIFVFVYRLIKLKEMAL